MGLLYNRGSSTLLTVAWMRLREQYKNRPLREASRNQIPINLTGHKPEGEHRKYTHHEMDNLRAAIHKLPLLGSK